MRSRNLLVSGMASLALWSSWSHGQFVHGITQPTFGTNLPAVFLTDTTTGASVFQFNATASVFPATAPGIGGLAADEPNNRLFASIRNGAQDDIWSIAYAGYAGTRLTTVRRPGLTTFMSVDGLAYDTRRSVLYGSRTTGGSTGPEALVSINIVTGETAVIVEYETTATSLFTFGAIDYDPLTDLIYLIDEDDTGGRNIYSVNPAVASPPLVLVSALPAIITDVDGLAAGEGKLYLVSDGPDIGSTAGVEGNGGNHYVYDIASGSFSILGPTPYPEYNTSALGRINPSAGAAFAPGLIPEPSSLSLLAVAGLSLVRRRR